MFNQGSIVPFCSCRVGSHTLQHAKNTIGLAVDGYHLFQLSTRQNESKYCFPLKLLTLWIVELDMLKCWECLS